MKISPVVRARIFRAMVHDQGLPDPVEEFRFAPPRRWRIDWAWPPQRIALEVEGGLWTHGRHTRGKGYLADVEKYNELALRGWCLLRVTPDQLCQPQTLDLLKRALTRDAA